MKSSPPVSLEKYQNYFKQLVVSERVNYNSTLIENLKIRSTQGFSVKKRIKTYRYAYLKRLQESLTDDFKLVIAKLIERHGKRSGRTFWNKLSTSYLRKNAPDTYSLYDLGEKLSSFIRLNYPEDLELAELAEMDFLGLIVSCQNREVPNSSSDQNTLLNLDETSMERVVLSLSESVRFWWSQPQSFHQTSCAFTHLFHGVKKTELSNWEVDLIKDVQQFETIKLSDCLEKIIEHLFRLKADSLKLPDEVLSIDLQKSVFESMKKLTGNGVLIIQTKEEAK